MSKRTAAPKNTQFIGPFKISNFPDHLYEQFKASLEKNGTDESTFFKLAIRSYLRRAQVFDLKDVITFGKYQECVLEEVIRVNPGYISWMIENTNNFKISSSAHVLLNEILGENGLEEIPF